MGGLIVQAVALRHSGNVTSVVLTATAPWVAGSTTAPSPVRGSSSRDVYTINADSLFPNTTQGYEALCIYSQLQQVRLSCARTFSSAHPDVNRRAGHAG